MLASARACRSETEISNLFERHMKILIDEKQRIINELIEWEKNLIHQVQDNVRQQKHLLEQQCRYQFEMLKVKRQEYLDTALIYEQRQDREEVRRLLEQCHHLKLQLISFEYPEKMIPFIQIQKIIKNENIHSTEKQQDLINKKCLSKVENDNAMDKCPACSVIFPSTMKLEQRMKHVNQHFGD